MDNDTCKNCGSALNGKAFCTQCGAPRTAAQEQSCPADEQPQTGIQAAEKKTDKVMPPEPKKDGGITADIPDDAGKTYEEPLDKAPKPEIPPGYAYYDEPPADSKYALVPSKSFFGLYILFSVPVIGWFVCIVMALGGCRNRNKRNFARAMFMLYLVFILLLCIITVIMYFTKPALLQTIIDWFYIL